MGQNLPYEYCIGIIDPKDPENSKNIPIEVTVTTIPNSNWLNVESIQTTQTDRSCGIENVVAVLKGIPKEQGEFEVILRATKGKARGEQNFTIKVGDGNQAPRFRTKDVTVARVGKVYTYNMWAEDPEGEPVSFEKVGNLPSWLFLKDNGNGTATLTGAPRESDVGKEHKVAIEARDEKPRNCQEEGCLKEFTIRVTDANTAPIFLSEPTVRAKIGEEYSYPIEVADPDGDRLTIAMTPTESEDGWFEFNFDPEDAKDDGTLTAEIKGVPDNEDKGKFPITLTARETDFVEGGLSTEQSYTLFIIDPDEDNVIPEFTSKPATLTVDEGSSYGYNIVVGDADNQLGDLTITAPTLPEWLDLITEDGRAVIRGIPSSKDIGKHPIILQVDDGTGGESQVLTIEVRNVNEAPIFISQPTGELTDCLYIYNVETFDPDEGSDLTISVLEKPDWLRFLANSDGTGILFSEEPPYSSRAEITVSALKTDRVILEVSDGELSSRQEFSLTYEDNEPEPNKDDCRANTPPEFEEGLPTTVIIAEGESFNYTARASDADGDPLTFPEPIQPSWINFTDNGDDSITFTGTPPKAGVGRSQVIALVSDGHSSDALAFVVEVTQTTNAAPEFASEPSESDLIAQEDNPYSYEIIARDSDGNTLAIGASQLPNWAEVIDNGDGTAILRGVPSNEDVGEHEVILFVSDGIDSVTQTFTISVQNTNDPPEFTSTPITRVNEDNTYLYNITTTDPDIGDSLTITGRGIDINGEVSVDAEGNALPAWLQLRDAGDGTAVLQGRPSNNNIDIYNIELKVTDGNQESDLQTFSITVEPVNDGPEAVNDTIATAEDTAISIDVLANDKDIDGDSLSITEVSEPTNGTAVKDGNRILYTPNLNFVGADIFVYTIEDSNGDTDSATVTVNVGSDNDPPSFTSTAVTAAIEDQLYSYSITATDPDDDDLTFAVANTTPLPAWLNLTDNGNGTALLAGTPSNSDVNGNNDVELEVSDGISTDTQSFSITVSNTADAPIFTSTPPTTAVQGQFYEYTAEANDPDGDRLTINVVSKPDFLNFTTSTATLSGTPTNDDVGVHSVLLTATDEDLATANFTVPQSFAITVENVNDAPVAVDDTTSTNEDNFVNILVLANDRDPDGDAMSIDSVTSATNGSITNTSISVTYTPNPNFSGSDSFEYTIKDTNGASATAMVTVTIDPQNDLPVANDDGATTPEDTDVTIDVLNNDSDVDGDSLTVSSVTQPSNGTVTNNNTDVTYSPDANFNGTDTFNYTINDGNGGTANAIVTVNVGGTNDNPVATADSATTNEDNPVIIQVLSNDSDPDRDSLNVASATSPANGTVANNGNSVTYTPDPNFNGTDTFNYTVEDGNGGTDTATVTITVDPQNDVPVANDDGATTPEDTDVTIDVLNNDSDVDGDSLTVSSVTQPSNGTVTNNGTDVTYSPNTNFNGTDTFNYTINDGNGGTANAIVRVDVGGTNDPPVAGDDSDNTTNEDNPITIQVLSNDIDPDGDSLNVASATSPANGTVTNNGNNVTYTPDPNFNGTDTFNYTVEDGNGGTDTATVTITVDPQNDVPVANDDGATTPEDTDVTIDVLGNDSDVDGDSLTVSSVTQPSNGTVTNNNTDVTYSPDANFNGTDTFNYTINDGNGGTATAIVTVNVGGTNDPPVAGDDSDNTTNEDNPITIQVLSNDIDPDGDSLNVASTTNPANGMVTNNGNSVTYTPDPNFNGTDAFNYTVSDGNSGTDTATVNVTVNAVNDAPSFTTTPPNPTSLDINEGDSFTYNIEATDPDGDVLSFNITFPSATQPSWLALSSTGNNMATLEGDTTSTEVGEHNVLLEVQDPDGEIATQSFTINVNAIPQFDSPPVTTADETVPYTYAIQTSDANHSGSELTITAPTLPSWLTTFTDNGNGTATLSGTPGSADVGPNSVELVVTDPVGASSQQSFDITVAGLQAPVITRFEASQNPIDIQAVIDAGMETWMSTLDWDVVGTPPVTLTIEQTVNGVTSAVGDVSNLPNIGVMPVGAPTTYTLTASNNQDTDTMDLVVTVNYPSGCVDPVNIPDINLEQAVLDELDKATGPISCLDMFGMTKLRGERSNISNLSGLEHASNLQLLDLQSNSIVELTPLASLSAMRNLDLTSNSINNIVPLQGMVNLQIIELASNAISDISALKNMITLQIINIGHNPIEGFNSFANASLPNLHTFDLGKGMGFTGDVGIGPFDISDLNTLNLPNLQNLDLSSADRYYLRPIDSLSDLANFTNLQTLSLAANNIINPDLSHLPNLPKLQALNLSYNEISNINNLPTLPSLRTLDLGRNNISDVSSLPTNLQILDLSFNNVVYVSSFPVLSNLQTLNLGYNQITDISGLAGSNTSLSSRDSLGLRSNCLDPEKSPDKDHIHELITRGVTVDTMFNPKSGCSLP